MRQLELENDTLREALIHLKGCGLGRMSDLDKTGVVESPRPKTGHALKELAASLRISKSSHEYRRAAVARKGKCGDLWRKIAETFERRAGRVGTVTSRMSRGASGSPPSSRGRSCAGSCPRRTAPSSTARRPSAAAPARARYRMRSPTWFGGISMRPCRTAFGSPISPSPASRPAKSAPLQCSTASTGRWRHGRYRPRRTQDWRTACWGPYARSCRRTSVRPSTVTGAVAIAGQDG